MTFTKQTEVTVTVAATTTSGVIGDVTVSTSEGWSHSGPVGTFAVPPGD